MDVLKSTAVDPPAGESTAVFALGCVGTNFIFQFVCTYVKTAGIAKELQDPLLPKENATVEKAAAYFGIGRNKLRELTGDENCKFVRYIGSKRQTFEKYLGQADSFRQEKANAKILLIPTVIRM